MKNSNTLQAFWLAIGNFSSFLLAIVSAAILSRYFSKTDYGTYRQVVYVYSTLLVIFTAGLPTVFSYFLPRYNLQQGKDIVLKVSRLLFYAGLLFSIFLFCKMESAANAPAACPVSKTQGCKRVEPFTTLLTLIPFSAIIKPSVPAGIKEPNGTL